MSMIEQVSVVDSMDNLTSKMATSLETNNRENVETETNEFYDVLSEYYKLKNEYTKKIQAQQNSIMKDETLSMKQKQDKYRKMKTKCINCGRNVGTIFNNDSGILTAVCGDKTNRCALNIKINRGKYLNLEDLIDTKILNQ